jgi:hypothetical protein
MSRREDAIFAGACGVALLTMGTGYVVGRASRIPPPPPAPHVCAPCPAPVVRVGSPSVVLVPCDPLENLRAPVRIPPPFVPTTP